MDHRIDQRPDALARRRVGRTDLHVTAGGTSPEEVRQFIGWSRLDIPVSFWRDLSSAGLLAPGTPLRGNVLAI